MKKSILAASILALTAASPALAQTTTTTPAPSAPAEKMEPADKKLDPAARPAAPSAVKPGDAALDNDKAARQASASSDWRASNLIGSSIVNAANESIGDINDLLIGTDGKVSSVVVGVGGFLGIGEKNVALPFSDLTVTRNENGRTVVMSKATKQTLETMPEWKAPAKL